VNRYQSFNHKNQINHNSDTLHFQNQKMKIARQPLAGKSSPALTSIFTYPTELGSLLLVVVF